LIAEGPKIWLKAILKEKKSDWPCDISFLMDLFYPAKDTERRFNVDKDLMLLWADGLVYLQQIQPEIAAIIKGQLLRRAKYEVEPQVTLALLS